MISSKTNPYEIIRTGSQGNAVVIEGEVLIDIGVPFKALEPHWRRLKLVLLTHSHSDHFNRSTVRRLAAERPTLRWGCCKWMVSRLLDAGVKKTQIDLYPLGTASSYCHFDLTVLADEIPHDVPNCCYHLITPHGMKILYATDTSSLDGIKAENYDLYLVEANHITEEHQQRIDAKHADGQHAYEERAMREHLSLEQCHAFFYAQGGPHSVLVPMHCHIDKEESAYAVSHA